MERAGCHQSCGGGTFSYIIIKKCNIYINIYYIYIYNSTELVGLQRLYYTLHCLSLSSSMYVQYIKMNGGRRPNQGRGTANQHEPGRGKHPHVQEPPYVVCIVLHTYISYANCRFVNLSRWAQISVWRCRRRPRAGRRALTRSRRARPLSMRTRPNPNTTSSKSSFSTCEMKAFPPR